MISMKRTQNWYPLGHGMKSWGHDSAWGLQVYWPIVHLDMDWTLFIHAPTDIAIGGTRAFTFGFNVLGFGCGICHWGKLPRSEQGEK